MNHRSKRAVLLLGAGASVEYGVPTTVGMGVQIEQRLAQDMYCVGRGGVEAYFRVKRALRRYYKSEPEAHFERIFHVLHELSEHSRDPSKAAPQFKSVLYPFLRIRDTYKSSGLSILGFPRDYEAACGATLDAIYAIVSDACVVPKDATGPFSALLSNLRRSHLVRAYTTNYDDFILQAGDDLYTGFTQPSSGGEYVNFDADGFWRAKDQDSVAYLHGSVHLGWPHELTRRNPMELAWFLSRDDARKHTKGGVDQSDRLDGTSVRPSAIVTGLDKLHRLQPVPFNHYYSMMASDIMAADLLIVIGCGLQDRHLVSWIAQVRRRQRRVPILVIDKWRDEFALITAAMNHEPRAINMIHDLDIPMAELEGRQVNTIDGLKVFQGKQAAVWPNGFHSFLSDTSLLEAAMAAIGA